MHLRQKINKISRQTIVVTCASTLCFVVIVIHIKNRGIDNLKEKYRPNYF